MSANQNAEEALQAAIRNAAQSSNTPSGVQGGNGSNASNISGHDWTAGTENRTHLNDEVHRDGINWLKDRIQGRHDQINASSNSTGGQTHDVGGSLKSGSNTGRGGTAVGDAALGTLGGVTAAGSRGDPVTTTDERSSRAQGVADSHLTSNPRYDDSEPSNAQNSVSADPRYDGSEGAAQRSSSTSGVADPRYDITQSHSQRNDGLETNTDPRHDGSESVGQRFSQPNRAADPSQDGSESDGQRFSEPSRTTDPSQDGSEPSTRPAPGNLTGGREENPAKRENKEAIPFAGDKRVGEDHWGESKPLK